MSGSERQRQARAGAAWALAGAWGLATLLLAAGLGPHLSDDALTGALVAAPGLAFLAVTLVRPRPHIPSRTLWSSPWSTDARPWRWLVRPFLAGVAAAAMTIAATYLGAGWSLANASADGAGRLLTGPVPYLDWWFLALGGTAAACLGYVVVLLVLLPVGAMLDARTAWARDRREAHRLLAFAGFTLGLLMTIVGFIVADPTPAQIDRDPEGNRLVRMLATLHDFVNVLVGGSSQAPVTQAGAWIARAGAGLLLASLVLYWQPGRRRER